MGEVWIAAQPRCPVHGQMRMVGTGRVWTCGGFDGEGCPRVVTDADIEWRALGSIRPGQWPWPFIATARQVRGG